MNLVDLFKKKKPVISFEIFPPKLDTPIESIFGTLEQFKELKPDFISLHTEPEEAQKTEPLRSHQKLKNEYGIESMAHLTCVGHSKEEIDALLTSMREHNLENILALRGDPPANQPDFDFSNNAFKYANELIAHVRNRTEMISA